MDELEISGKRYISTRRAAKEYKYHSDYIGQLIRGKKLLGRKVGRSWYVELDSIVQFFGKEGVSIPQAPLVAREVKQEVAAPVEVVAEVVVEKKFEPVAQIINREPEQKIQIHIEEKNLEINETPRDSIHIPVRVQRPSFESAPVRKAPTLTYMSDDEPYIPAIRKASTELSGTVVMPRTEEEAEEMFEEEVEEAPQEVVSNSRLQKFIPVFGVAALGVIALIVVVGGSILVSSHTVVEAGKSASVGYTLQ
jgi:hypothetical protein